VLIQLSYLPNDAPPRTDDASSYYAFSFTESSVSPYLESISLLSIFGTSYPILDCVAQ
jgi:hypothetical protein